MKWPSFRTGFGSHLYGERDKCIKGLKMRLRKTIVWVALALTMGLIGIGLWAFTTQKDVQTTQRALAAVSDMHYATGYFVQNDETHLFDFYIDMPTDVQITSWERDLWGTTEIILRDGAEQEVARWEIQNHENHTEFLMEGDYTLFTQSKHNLMGGYVVAATYVANRLPLLDSDADGLPDPLEQAARTNPQHSDSDGDGLSDYDEIRKYRTDPLAADSDGDGLGDFEWHERREYAYTIQAIVNLRPPFELDEMQDFYQDVRLITELDDNVTQLEVILYPEAREIINPASFAPQNTPYTAPTFTKNYGRAMQTELDELVQGSATDLEATLRVIRTLVHETQTVRPYEDLGYSSSLPLNFEMYLTPTGDLLRTSHGEISHMSREEIETAVLFADSMFANQTRGACSSTSTLRGAMLRAAGLEEKIIVTIPLLYFYEEDGTEVQVKAEYWDDQYAAMTGSGATVANHFFNMVKIGNRWIRVDHTIYNGTTIANTNAPFIKILEQNEILENDFTRYWNYDSWREKRPYQYVSIIEQEPTHNPNR